MEKASSKKCELFIEELHCVQNLNHHIEYQDKVPESRKNKIKCNLCGHEFHTWQNLMNHTTTHTGERLFKCKIIGCGQAFKREAHLSSHITCKHNDARPYKCDFPGCIFRTKTPGNLKTHKRVHSDGRPFPCIYSGCNFWAKSKPDISKHVANVHRKSKALSCYKCSYNTNTASNLARHMIVHEGRNEQLPCSIEGCEHKAKNSQALKFHMARHKTLLPCPLRGCGRYVTTKRALKDHVKLHSPSDRPFRCPLCFKNFKALSQMQKHCFVHTNEKPFKCGHCDHAAGRKPDVKSHISTVHASTEFPFIVHLLEDRECLRCKVTLRSPEFVVHCKGHVNHVVMTHEDILGERAM